MIYINADGVPPNESAIRQTAWRKAIKAATELLAKNSLDYAVYHDAKQWAIATKKLPIEMNGNRFCRAKFLMCETELGANILDATIKAARVAFNEYIQKYPEDCISPKLAKAMWGDHEWYDNMWEYTKLLNNTHNKHKVYKIVQAATGKKGKTVEALTTTQTTADEVLATIIALLWCSPSLSIQTLYQFTANWLSSVFLRESEDSRLGIVLLAVDLLSQDTNNYSLLRGLQISKSIDREITELHKNGNNGLYVKQIESLCRMAKRIEKEPSRIHALEVASMAIICLSTQEYDNKLATLQSILTEVVTQIKSQAVNTELPSCIAWNDTL